MRTHCRNRYGDETLIIIKKVILKGSSSKSRKGAYFRIRDSEKKITQYYKVSKRTAKTKEKAYNKFAVRKQKQISEMPKKIKEFETEDATLHFRLDYSTEARGGHHFEMRDSHITARIPKNMTDTEARDNLKALFTEAFNDQFGSHLSEMIEEDDMVEGLERGSGNREGIRIKYNYGGRGWKTADTTPGIVRDIVQQKEKFFYGTLKRGIKHEKK